jgi:hypothetical protein
MRLENSDLIDKRMFKPIGNLMGTHAYYRTALVFHSLLGGHVVLWTLAYTIEAMQFLKPLLVLAFLMFIGSVAAEWEHSNAEIPSGYDMSMPSDEVKH